MRLFLLIAAIAMPVAGASAETTKSKYAGQQSRSIKSLSAADIAELRRGGGWWMAKAAELNGVPGPAHLLELKDRIPLTPGQVVRIEALRADMTSKAIVHGERLIALEARLEKHFRERSVTDDILRDMLSRIAETRRELRYAHLSTHLKTPEILTHAQIARYNTLRGYGGDAHGDGGHGGHGR